MTRRFVAELEARRQLLEPYAAISELPPEVDARWKAPFGPPEDWDLDIHHADIEGPHGPVPVRVYAPRTPPPVGGRPALVWMHGGAFAWGDLDMPEADAVSRGIAGRTGAVVVSVDYRLCPVPPELGGESGDTGDRVDERGRRVCFPVPHDDCYAAFTAVRDRASTLGIDPVRLAIGGASAGGCLAAGVALCLADEGRAPWQVLLAYQVVHPSLPPASGELAEAIESTPPALLFPPQMRGAIDRNFLGGQDPTPYAYAGLAEDLSHFPPTFIENSEFDVLRSSPEEFARQLQIGRAHV